jgi:hypothetical protein
MNSKTTRITGRIVVVIICLIFVITLIIFPLDIYKRKQAEQLAQELQTVNLGEPSAQEALSFIHRFGGAKIDTAVITNETLNPGVGPCAQADETYSIERGLSYTANRVLAHLRPLHKMGLQPWMAGATIYLRNHVVLCVAFSASVFDSDGQEIEARAQLTPHEEARDEGASRYRVSVGTLRGHIHILEAHVSPEATPEQRRHAFAFDLACLTTLGGCQRPCQIMPWAWHDAVAGARDQGWSPPKEDLDDPRCSKLPTS